jgi:hypothetical protein
MVSPNRKSTMTYFKVEKKNYLCRRMKLKIISGYLFVVMMIVVLHNVIPHHHHEDILIHNHHEHDNQKDPHSGNDHKPVTCLIQTIDLNVPRSFTTIKNGTPACIMPLIGTSVNSILLSNADFIITFVSIPPGDPVDKVAIINLPARGPPC